MKIKRINRKNYISFYKAFYKIKDLRTSDRILFYQISEIKEWINSPKNNLLYGIFMNKKCIGFCFCKIMSCHWALIDAFYIKNKYRFNDVGKNLQLKIEHELKNRKIKYISRIVNVANIHSQKFLSKTGYKNINKYIWFEKFLN